VPAGRIRTGSNPADNFWRNGNLPEHGQHRNQDNRADGAEHRGQIEMDEAHPGTGQAVTSTRIPDWTTTQALAKAAAQVLPGI